ncbi:hypothetical protein DENSPDRAFT_838333 [Dentipellis sp. KUC8613]|nr:hypothetical protein DENSPDRAFT_838333 [Dentipellis sp. KUC8613]
MSPLHSPSIFILTVVLIHQTVAALAVHIGEYVEDKIIYHVPSPGVIIAVAIAVFGQYRFATFQSTRRAFTSPSSVALVFAIFMLAYFFNPPEAGPLRLPLRFYRFVRRGQASRPQTRPHRAYPVSARGRRPPRSAVAAAPTASTPARVLAAPVLVPAAPAQAHLMQRESVLHAASSDSGAHFA